MLKRLVLKRLVLSLLLIIAVAAVAGLELQKRWQAPLHIGSDGYALTVSAGSSLGTILQQLAADGVLEHPWMLALYARYTKADQNIKRGEYLIPPGLSAQQLLQQLERGDVVQYQLTLPEGLNLTQAIARLAQQPALRHLLTGSQAAELLELVAPYNHPEGLFFPDTYQFERGDSDVDILRRAHRSMLQQLDQLWAERDAELPYESPYEALIMASIIERETGLAAERAEIAGVFVRRLQRKMRLQTDPTVIYGLGESFDGNLKRSHLRDDSNAYNTYRHHGLPPTPICLPGREAIYAALHPAPGDSLYFVATGDGGHVFSRTLAEHQAAVRKYQLQRRADYRSSPGSSQ